MIRQWVQPGLWCLFDLPQTRGTSPLGAVQSSCASQTAVSQQRGLFVPAVSVRAPGNCPKTRQLMLRSTNGVHTSPPPPTPPPLPPSFPTPVSAPKLQLPLGGCSQVPPAGGAGTPARSTQGLSCLHSGPSCDYPASREGWDLDPGSAGMTPNPLRWQLSRDIDVGCLSYPQLS